MTTRNNSTPVNANARLANAQAAAANKAELEKLAKAKAVDPSKKVEDEAEQLAAETATEAGAAEPITLAAADAAVVGTTAAAEASGAAAAGSAAAGAGAGAAAGAATISPLAIGAGIFGVAAVAAAASGSSSGGSSNSSNDPIAQDPNTNTNTNTDPGTGTGTGTVTDPGTGSGSGSGTGTGTETTNPTYGQATAQGTGAAPKVATEGETKLSKAADAFKEANNGTEPEFIRITTTFAAEGDEAAARVVRWGEDSGVAPAGIGTAAAALKAPDAEAAATETLTAYEVIKVAGGVTLAQAEEMAAKLGGKLMVVNDAKEQSWIAANLYGILGANSGEEAELLANGAWIGGNSVQGDAKIDAVLRGEDPKTAHYFDAQGEKLNAFVVEFGNYQWPLQLQTADGLKPVENGAIISKADFGKLVWNSDANKVGLVNFEVVDSNDKETAKVVAGSKPGTLTITESAEVVRPVIQSPTKTEGDNTGADNTNGAGANTGDGGSDGGDGSGNGGGGNPPVLATYPESNSKNTTVVTDSTDTALDANLFRGTGTTAPTFIKITEVKPTGLAAEAGSPLSLKVDDDVDVIPTDGGYVVGAANFDKLIWDASTSTGGVIHFIQVADDKGTELPGAKQQTIVIAEVVAPKVPEAPTNDPAAPVEVTHNGSKTLDKALFEGTDPAKAPGWIKITAIQNKEGEDAAAETMKLDDSAAASNKTIAVDTIIAKEDFDNIVWDASKNDGGSFSFIPVNAEGVALEGATTPQKVTINEAAAPVTTQTTYKDGGEKVAVGHDQSKTFDQAIFEGNSAGNKATHIKITEIKGAGADGQDASAGALKVEGQAEPLKVGDVVAAANFGKISWNADGNEGGSFKFTPVQASGDAFSNAPVQTVTVTEHPAVPKYNGDKLAVEHDQTLTLEASKVLGTNNAAQFVKITEINGSTSTESASAILKVDGQGVTVGQTLTAAQAAKLTWDTSTIDGEKTFKFQAAVDDQGTLLIGSEEQTVTINEHPQAPNYEPGKTVSATPDQTNAAIDKAIFEGTAADAKPAFIKITDVLNGDGEKLADALLKDGTAINLSSDSVIAQADFDKLTWDASKSTGAASFKFQAAVDANGTPLLGSAEQTVKITEAAAQEENGGEGLGTQKSISFFGPNNALSYGFDDLLNPSNPLI